MFVLILSLALCQNGFSASVMTLTKQKRFFFVFMVFLFQLEAMNSVDFLLKIGFLIKKPLLPLPTILDRPRLAEMKMLRRSNRLHH